MIMSAYNKSHVQYRVIHLYTVCLSHIVTSDKITFSERSETRVRVFKLSFYHKSDKKFMIEVITGTLISSICRQTVHTTTTLV